MTTTRGAAITTAVRVVDRVHDDTAVMRTLAAPNRTTSLAVVDVGVIRVRNRTDRSKAGAVHETLFARVQAKDRHALVTTDQLDATRFVTHHFSLDQFDEAYDVFGRAADTGALKVVLTRS